MPGAYSCAGIGVAFSYPSKTLIIRIPTGEMRLTITDRRCGEAYDSVLFIVIAPGWHIELFATKLKSEITH
jgi:hypothetical protein